MLNISTATPFISPPTVACLYFNTGGTEGLDTGNTIPYFPPGAPVFNGHDATLAASMCFLACRCGKGAVYTVCPDR